MNSKRICACNGRNFQRPTEPNDHLVYNIV